MDLTQPPPKVGTSPPIDYRLEPLLDDDQRAWALAHTLDVVWRPVLTSVGIGVRADLFFQSAGVDPEVFVAIVTGARRSRRTWQRADLGQMATATGISDATIATLNKHMSSRWEDVVNGRALDAHRAE